MLFILDKFGTVVSALTNDAPDGCPYWNDSHVESLDGELSYDFECPGDHEQTRDIVPECMVLFRDLNGVDKLCRIKTVDEQTDGAGRHVKLVHSEGTHGDLNGYIVRPVTFTGETFASILASLLGGTEWTSGTVHWAGTLDMAFAGHETVLAAIRYLISENQLEVSYRVEFDGNQITGRYVDALDRIGTETGKTFTYAKDIKGLRRTIDSSEFITAMIGLGGMDEDDIRVTITDEVWTVAGGDPADKPAEQDWVGDETALETYGHSTAHIMGVFEDTNETSPSKLLTKTWNALQVRNAPTYSYEIDAVLLDRLITDGDHERVSLGDTVRVKDATFSPPVFSEVRVTEIRRSYSDPAGTGFQVRRGVLA